MTPQARACHEFAEFAAKLKGDEKAEAQLLAAFGGAFRAAARAKDEEIQGPIFAHPRFQREAEGATIHGKRLA